MKNLKLKGILLAKVTAAVVILIVGTAVVNHLYHSIKSTYVIDSVGDECYSGCKDYFTEKVNKNNIVIDKMRQVVVKQERDAEMDRVIAEVKAKEEAKRIAEEKRRAELAKIEAEKRRKAAELEKARQQRREERVKQPQIASRGSEYKGVNQSLGKFNVSWYGKDCAGCSGITASGVSVKHSIYYNGYGVAASDWSVIPPYSIIEVEGYGKYIVLDRGGAIRNKKLDLLTTSEARSYEYGRQNLNVTVLRWGYK